MHAVLAAECCRAGESHFKAGIKDSGLGLEQNASAIKPKFGEIFVGGLLKRMFESPMKVEGRQAGSASGGSE